MESMWETPKVKLLAKQKGLHWVPQKEQLRDLQTERQWDCLKEQQWGLEWACQE